MVRLIPSKPLYAYPTFMVLEIIKCMRPLKDNTPNQTGIPLSHPSTVAHEIRVEASNNPDKILPSIRQDAF